MAYDENYTNGYSHIAVLEGKLSEMNKANEELREENKIILAALDKMTDRYLDAKAALEIERERVAVLRAVNDEQKTSYFPYLPEFPTDPPRRKLFKSEIQELKNYCDKNFCHSCPIRDFCDDVTGEERLLKEYLEFDYEDERDEEIISNVNAAYDAMHF